MNTSVRVSIRAAVMLLALLTPIIAFAQAYTPIQFFRPYDQRGINVFEPPKEDTVAFEGLNLKWGVGFAQQFQAIDHENNAIVRNVTDATGTYNANELIDIGPGFNLATANLNLDAQLADGVRLNLITYLSSRHHNEAWVKGGYLQIDKLPFLHSQAIDDIMQYVTLRVGHFELNYGDGHWRRSDNGNAMYNPFVGNWILDAFTTEIGGELYVRSSGLMAMVGLTGGENQGSIIRPAERSPSIYGKIGFDKQLSPDLRVRLTGSTFYKRKAIANTLYSGDRAGSRYYLVVENVRATPSAQFTSGLINPNFRYKNTSFMVNPFIKFQGLELFGLAEWAQGRAATETDERTFRQFAGEALFRFLPREQLYIGGRFNTVRGDLGVGFPTAVQEIGVNRWQIGAGWFVTPQILAKLEYVNEEYQDFPSSDIRSEARFNGFMIEGVIAF